MPDLAVYSMEGKKTTEKVDFPDTIFDGEVNTALLHQAVVMYGANKRQGNASTKTRAEVSGGGRKPWRQKGTGRARVGSIRSPLWRHGGVVFGPHPHDFRHKFPKRIKIEALRSSLNEKLNKGEITVVDKIEIDKPKTKEIINLLSKLKIKEKTLGVLEIKSAQDRNIFLASKNIPFFNLMRPEDLNAYEVLKHRRLLISKGALKDILKRLKG